MHVKYRGHNLIGVKFKGGLERSISARAARRGVRLAAVLRRVLERQLRARQAGRDRGAAFTSLVPMLADELTKAANLVVADGDDDLVLLTRHDESARVV